MLDSASLLHQSSTANVAQLVEQLIRNQQVSGSSPLVGFNHSDKLLGEKSLGVTLGVAFGVDFFGESARATKSDLSSQSVGVKKALTPRAPPCFSYRRRRLLKPSR